MGRLRPARVAQDSLQVTPLPASCLGYRGVSFGLCAPLCRRCKWPCCRAIATAGAEAVLPCYRCPVASSPQLLQLPLRIPGCPAARSCSSCLGSRAATGAGTGG